MAFNSNGQISYLVLDSLSHGSKYGLEIIEFISQKTNGSYIMKKPTLYSCLTRMEKKGLVSSSYWGESEFGGKRHYYSITNQGKATLEDLAKDFENSTYDEEPIQQKSETTVKTETLSTTQDKPVFLQQDNIFDMVKKEDKPITIEPQHHKEESNIIDNQIDIFSFQASQQVVENENTVLQAPQSTEDSTDIAEKPQDDAKFLDKNETFELSPFQTEQNQRLYDTSSELKRYRKKKSFSENQIEMAVVYESAEDAEIQRSRIEQLKKSMLEAKNNSLESIKLPEKQEISTNQQTAKQVEKLEKVETLEDNKDDAVFITNPRIDENSIPIQKKITPPNIEVNIYDDNLPAPKRDSNLEPTYKDMMAKLFERKKEKKPAPVEQIHTEEVVEVKNVDTFADYGTLKKYYNNHGIAFQEYKKSNVERRHNTNFLNFIISATLLALSGIGCALLFWLISGLGLLRPSTNFMFYTLPLLFFSFSVFKFVLFKVSPSKKASILYNGLINWTVFILASLVIFVINITCGMQYETIPTYLTSLLIPMLGILLAFPVNYYIKKFVYKKFAV